MKRNTLKQRPQPLFEALSYREQKPHLDIDLDALYEHTFSELGLQQTKRDQIITLYLAMFSFLIPFALSMEGISLRVKGLIFLVAAVVGILFSFIIIRYRIYKEVYWLCCQTLTVLHGIKEEKLDKHMIQKVFYQTLKKKAKSYMVGQKDGEKAFSNCRYVEKNLFSSESIYFFIHVLLTALIFGLGIALICPGTMLLQILVGIVFALGLFIGLAAAYFAECVQVYAVAADETDESFNKAFSKAWFLHFYI